MSSGLLRKTKKTSGRVIAATTIAQTTSVVCQPCDSMRAAVGMGVIADAAAKPPTARMEWAVPSLRSNHIAMVWPASMPSEPCPRKRTSRKQNPSMTMPLASRRRSSEPTNPRTTPRIVTRRPSLSAILPTSGRGSEARIVPTVYAPLTCSIVSPSDSRMEVLNRPIRTVCPGMVATAITTATPSITQP